MTRRALSLLVMVPWLAACPPKGERRVDLTDVPADAGDAPAACLDDSHEPDDTMASVQAKIWERPSTIEDAVSCPGNDDYVHGRADGEEITVVITWHPDDGELRLDMFDGEGDPVQSTEESTITLDRSPGRIELHRDSVDGDFYVRVRNLSGVRIPYVFSMR